MNTKNHLQMMTFFSICMLSSYSLAWINEDDHRVIDSGSNECLTNPGAGSTNTFSWTAEGQKYTRYNTTRVNIEGYQLGLSTCPSDANKLAVTWHYNIESKQLKLRYSSSLTITRSDRPDYSPVSHQPGGSCLSVNESHGLNPGAEVITRSCDDPDSIGQAWLFDPVTQTIRLEENDNLCLIDGSGGITLDSCDPSLSTKWNVGDRAIVLTSVPILSGPNASVIESGNFNSSYPSWSAFDGSLSSMWISKTWETPAILGYDFETAVEVTQYAIHYSNGSIKTRAPKEFTLQGSNDNGNSWSTVDTQTNQTNWAGLERRLYDVSNPGLYSQYRLVVTDDNDSRSGVVVISIGDFDLLID